MYGHKDVLIRVRKLREALWFLELNHHAYNNITISEKNVANIKEALTSQTINPENDRQTTFELKSATQQIRYTGKNQTVEESIAQVAVTNPLTVETDSSKQEISDKSKHLFTSLSLKSNGNFVNRSSREGWSLMFPCLLWDGKGGPDSCVHNTLSLRESFPTHYASITIFKFPP